MKDGFEEVASLDCDTAVTLGGVDKKTRKNNPTEIEGYYLGAKQVPSTMAASGFTPLHILLTDGGNVGIWGKSDLNRKLVSVQPGQYIAIEFVGMKKIKNFPPMYTYKVGVRKGDVMDVGSLSVQESLSDDDGSTGDTAVYDNEEVAADVPVYQTASKPPVTSPSAAAQAKARALLGASRKS